MSESDAYAALSRINLAGRPLGETLHEVTLVAQRMLPQHPDASFTLIAEDGARTVASSGSIALRLDERQYANGFGPCLDAARSGQTFKLSLRDSYDLYPDFCEVGLWQGVTHSMSIGLPVAAETVGALNLYSTAGPFSEDATRTAGTFASFAGLVLADAVPHRGSPSELATQITLAVRSRASVEQSKGLLMAEHGVSPEEAFEMLVRLAQSQDLSIRATAEALIDQARRPWG